MPLHRRLRSLLAAAAILFVAHAAAADTTSILTLNYPTLPGPGIPDTDGYLNPAAQTFQEGGMHLEQFWVKNNIPAFSADAHFHIKFPNPFEISHGFGNSAGLGPDRTGIFLRREDGGPFDLVSLDYRLVTPTATNLMVGTSYDPTQPITSQLDLYPVTAAPNFQPFQPAGYTNLTQLFLGWDLTESINDRAEIDNIVVKFPSGSCNPAIPGGIVVSHNGQADPTTEGWNAEGAATNVVVGPINDAGTDAWTVDDNATGAGSSRNYTYYPSYDVMCWVRSAGFKLRSKVRVVDLPDSTDGSVHVSFSDSAQLFEMRLGQSASAHPIVWLSNSSVTLNTLDNGYHVFEMIYDPVTATADVLVDGVEVLSNRPGLAQNVAAPRVRFGSAYDFTTGHGNYAFVEFSLPSHCANGVDDDGDGDADYPADDGCTSATDASETGLCGNELDDDGDGSIDFPADVGCDDADDSSERGPAFACDDDADNDGDLATDYPADAGCASPSDMTETAACENAADDDGDGVADFPADPGCSSATDDSEKSPSLLCDDGADNDGDTLVDFPSDGGCASLTDPTETFACSDGNDDDGDGAVDFPADPGCADADDDSEKSLALVCDDGADNDGDTWIDFPADPGCAGLLDTAETTACSDGTDDDGDGAVDFPADPGCADADDDSEKSPALVCDDGDDNDGDTLIDFPSDPGCVDLADAAETAACSNGADDDGDGTTDFPADPGCSDANDHSEKSPALACDDGNDNDGDTLVDFPSDPGCVDLADAAETAACSDGSDDDGDGLVDFPADPGCADANDDSEKSATLVCDDGVDQDGDARIDFPADPGCADANDGSEKSATLVCDDGVDQDGDGAIDFPADPGCRDPAFDLENPRCQDGLDNDSDGAIDFDGGAAANGGVQLGAIDPNCVGKPYRTTEAPSACGLGFDLAFLLPVISALHRRRARRAKGSRSAGTR